MNMLKLNVQDETSRLKALVVGTAKSNGPTPALEEAYDPKSKEHIIAGTYPKEEDMVAEMEGLCEVLEKHGVTVYRPEVIEGYNQIFSRDICFVIDDVLVKSNILPDREKEIHAIDYVLNQIDPKKILTTTEDVHFEIMDYSGKDLVKDLKLRKTFHVSNMHLFHPVKGIYKYSSPEEILKDFVELRIDHYIKRKAHLIKVLETRATMCGYKSKFVTMVIEGDIVVFKRKKQDLERQLAGIFPQIAGSHDYLLNIKTVQYTEESVKALIQEAKQTREELEIMKKTSHIDMWKMDIKNM